MLLEFMLTPRGLALDRSLVKWTGYSVLNRLFAKNAGYKPRPALLLVTRGSKTGMPREVALPYFELDGKLVVVGSKGGAPEDPFWANNLRRSPSADIYIQRRKRTVHARVAQGSERIVLWPQLEALVPTYAEYQAKTAREIPVIVLEPVTRSK